MNTFNLTQDQIDALWLSHSLAKDKHAADRIKSIYLLSQGMRAQEIARVLMIDEDTVRNNRKRYEADGIQGLLKNNYKGSKSYLMAEQIACLIKELDAQVYLTTQSVIEYVEKKFKVCYSPSGMRDLLHRLNYVYKKPKLVPGNPNHEAQEIFAQEYEEFMLKKPDDVEVLFMDAVHPEHNTMAAYGWIKRGEKRKIPTSSGRDKLNLHGAINAETYEMTLIESETVDADSTIQLLEMVEQKYVLASKIFVILDNAKYHYSWKVRDFLKSSRIKLVFLPSYAPNLNLIERVWKFFKKKVLYNTYYEKVDDFRRACIKFFRNMGAYQNELASIMSSEFELA